ncbi:MAG: MATE family efflux transporter [Clostridia bacterium]|nr:MATE family efflux transporter [Clostridia bacterium]
MIKTNQIEMTKGPLLGKIIMFALPLIASGSLQLLYNAADLIIVGQFASNGQKALASVGATSAIINLILNVVIGLSVGTAVIVARCIGAEDREGAHRATHTSIAVSLISGIVVGAFGFFMARQLLTWMNTPEDGDVLNMAVTYMKIYFVGAPMNMLYNFGSAVLRATGDTKRPLYFLTIAGLANIVFNFVFVYFFHLDVEGVAIATLISQTISAVLVTICLCKTEGPCKLEFKKLHIYKKEFKQIAIIGLPAGLQGSLFSISNVIIQSSINSFGDIVMSGNTAAVNIEGFIYIAENAFYHAAITFTGQNYGARQYKRTRKVFRICSALTIGVGIVLSALICIFGRFLLAIYLPGEEEAINFGMTRIFVVMIPYFTLGMCNTVVGQLRGLGYSISPVIISIFGICGIRIAWVYTVFAANKTLENLYTSYPISWAITFLATLVVYFIAVKKLPQDGELPLKEQT